MKLRHRVGEVVEDRSPYGIGTWLLLRPRLVPYGPNSQERRWVWAKWCRDQIGPFGACRPHYFASPA